MIKDISFYDGSNFCDTNKKLPLDTKWSGAAVSSAQSRTVQKSTHKTNMPVKIKVTWACVAITLFLSIYLYIADIYFRFPSFGSIYLFYAFSVFILLYADFEQFTFITAIYLLESGEWNYSVSVVVISVALLTCETFQASSEEEEEEEKLLKPPSFVE